MDFHSSRVSKSTRIHRTVSTMRTATTASVVVCETTINLLHDARFRRPPAIESLPPQPRNCAGKWMDAHDIGRLQNRWPSWNGHTILSRIVCTEFAAVASHPNQHKNNTNTNHNLTKPRRISRRRSCNASLGSVDHLHR